MLLTIINRIAKAVFAFFAIVALHNNELQRLPIYIILGDCLLLYVVTETFLSTPKKPKRGPFGQIPEQTDGSDENLTEDDIVFQEFFSQIIAHCSAIGIEATVQTKTDGYWLVKVDNNTGSTEDLVNLTIPDVKLTRDNLKDLIKQICTEIDVRVNLLKK